MTENYEVSGFSEMILDTVIEGDRFTGEAKSTDIIVEPSTDLCRDNGICTSSSITDISNHRDGKMRVMNPSGKGSSIGLIQSLGTK